MAQPTDVKESRRFMRMLNQLEKFSPCKSCIHYPTNVGPDELKVSIDLGPGPEKKSFLAAKAELSKPTVLALYNPESKTKFSSDALSYGLGAVLLQEHGDE